MDITNTDQSVRLVGELDLRFPLRTNISCVLSPAILEHVRLLNTIIVTNGFQEIDFSGSPAPIPHMTLLMGEVDDLSGLEAMMAALRRFAVDLAPIKYEITKPYLRVPSRNFIFVDAVPQKAFRGLRFSLHELLSEYIDCELYGGPENVSHITLGYAHGAYPGVDKLVQATQSVIGVADTLQVAETGKRGTCQRLIAKIPMGEKAG